MDLMTSPILGLIYVLELNEKEEKPHVAEQWKFNQLAPENRPGGNAEGRRHHGRHQRRAGSDRRKGGRGLGDGTGAGPGADSRRGRRGAHGVAEEDSRDYGRGFHSRDGQVPHRTFRGSPNTP